MKRSMRAGVETMEYVLCAQPQDRHASPLLQQVMEEMAVMLLRYAVSLSRKADIEERLP